MFQIKETGVVREVRQAIASVAGLQNCLNGQQVHFTGEAIGMVMGYKRDEVQVLILKERHEVRSGDPVTGLMEAFEIPVGDAYVGRIVDALGDPIDGKGPIKPSGKRPIFGTAPSVLERTPIEDPMPTGVKILDQMIPIGRGQRELIIGDRKTGKTTLVTDAILNQKGKGVICIYCGIGKPESAINKVVALFQERGAMDYTVIVAGTASSPAGQQYLAPYVACSIGEYFMNKGGHVLVGFDDFTKHAWIYRQLSLLMERAPGREAYPGDIFYLHSRMIELAANLGPERGGGSMTFLPIVETLQGDVTGYVPTNLISMTDGQIYLSTDLFSQGFKPSIDLGLSISRIGSKVQWPAIKELSGTLRLEYIQYRELERLTRLKANISAELEAKLKRGRVVTELIQQNKNGPVALEEQVVILYLLRQGKFDPLPIEQVRFLKTGLIKHLKMEKPELFTLIEKERKLSPEIKDALQIVGNVDLKKCLEKQDGGGS